MSDLSPRLALPLLAPAQAQKHVTHNEALQRLDALVQLTLEAVGATTPPPAPVDGTLYAIGTGATGDWAGQDGQLAYRSPEGVWIFLPPQAGWRAWDLDTGQLRVFDGSGWPAAAGAPTTQNLDGLGVNTTSDPLNRLSVAAAGTLFSHDGSDHRTAINKAAAADTGTVLFQTGFSGRAEMGLAGSDDWSIKVSPDGSSWTEALRFAATTGLAGGAAVQSGQTDAAAGRLMTTGAFGLGGLLPLAGNISVTDNSISTGFYRYQTASGSSGAPAAIINAHLLHTRRSTGGGETQIIVVETGNQPFTSGTLMARVRIAGAWSDWRRMFDNTSAVGPVSQSAGLPTGGLMERGTTASGTFRRLADGTQVCSHAVTTSGTADLTWNYPATFASGSTPVLSVQPVSADARIGVLVSASATQAVVAVRDLANARQAASCHLTAVGRWF
ncbi:DUF2793 domain-containing protein [Oceaniglobus roseus]|uniref:DUF2793 domain-containing protein n=1 Tax=Oceaniglobus roseus TaxID=1737570 RepID=UPI000C7EC97B|nr:DUF2793 domain-containing protein [Kandeliimicrobium roseum]